MKFPTFSTSLIVGALLALTSQPIVAQSFSLSDAKLFVGWPGLETPDISPTEEIKVYAIVEQYGAVSDTLYVILYTTPRSENVIGTMWCNQSFEVDRSSWSGPAYEIDCGQDGELRHYATDDSGTYIRVR